MAQGNLFKESYTFSMKTTGGKGDTILEDITMKYDDLEFVTDLLDKFLIFIRASGFSYIGQITAKSSGGDKEWESESLM